TLDRTLDRVAHFTTDEDVTVVQSRRGHVTGFDNATGRKLWVRQLGRNGDVSFPATSNADIVVIPTGSNIYGIQKLTGNMAWEVPVPGAPSVSAVTDSKHVYVGTVSGTVYAFDLAKLSRFYKEALLPRWSKLTQAWVYQTGSSITTPAVTTGLVVNFAARDGQLYGLSAEERKLRFQFETDAPIAAPMAYSGSKLYLASEDFNVYCLNADNGVIQWEFVSGLPIRKQAQVVGNHVYLLPDGGGMYALADSDGQELWLNPKANEFLAATSSLVYASDSSGNVLILGREDGATLGMIPLRDFDVRVSNDRTDRVYLTTSTGLTVCLRELNRPFPIYHKYPDRQPVLPEVTPEGAPPAADDAAAPAQNDAPQP
ncbi:MAG: PQQ-binding-like beta-propeller repeat protein, partial [Planctomycetaceae bacterium]